jgi:hypothetical protein
MLLVLGLLGGTAAAFAITEGLKLEKSPITRTRVTKLFSPECNCPEDRAVVEFRIRRGDKVTTTVLRQDETIATLSRGEYFRRGNVKLIWDGRDSAAAVVPGGTYRVRVHLTRRHQTINLPNTIEVDRTPPVITVTALKPRIFSPDHDGRADYVTISFKLSEPARSLLYADGTLVGRGRIERTGGKLHWFGKRDGRSARPGLYRLTLKAEDRAGNVSQPTRAFPVQIRYLALGRDVVRVRPAGSFAVRVASDAKRVEWLLHGKTGRSQPGTLKLRAPKAPGRYSLYVTAVSHSQKALVIVANRP